MIKRIDPFVLTEEQVTDGALANWAWDSHSWVEYSPGYYECEWCKVRHTSVQGIYKDYPLCPENYCIKKYRGDVKNEA